MADRDRGTEGAATAKWRQHSGGDMVRNVKESIRRRKRKKSGQGRGREVEKQVCVMTVAW